MPKSSQQLIDELEGPAQRFEDYHPQPEHRRDPRLYRDLEAAVRARAESEKAIVAAVAAMRADGDTWATIGWILGTSGQAAQQRYGQRRPS